MKASFDRAAALTPNDSTLSEGVGTPGVNGLPFSLLERRTSPSARAAKPRWFVHYEKKSSGTTGFRPGAM
jgi:hypothetical protein